MDHPNLDTPVGKLPFVGPETVRKLADIEKVAMEKGLRVPGIPLDLNRITTGDRQMTNDKGPGSLHLGSTRHPYVCKQVCDDFVIGEMVASLGAVGQLKELITVAIQLPQSELATNLPKVLGISKDCWPAVKELALKAIQPDSRPRAFFPPSVPVKGLLFAAKEGQVDTSQPSGKTILQGRSTFERSACCPSLNPYIFRP